MGSNMQRQAVPIDHRQERRWSVPELKELWQRIRASRLLPKRDGVVSDVNAGRIVLQHDFSGSRSENPVTIYNLSKFIRSNQNTCFNHRPIVKKGQVIKAGEIIADGPATEMGELALGKNVTVAFMPWGGYNFEDSILVSERLVRDGIFTSVHIEEFEVVARDYQAGQGRDHQRYPQCRGGNPERSG